ncbi:MAG: carboxypeptidase-like regulatory domain-containing protein [Candidatus Eisenbacteria bacterium]|uniref:Carboxypeptidase-like regulatory domain-containing protein n=1 Tax=Eiseniibacteriota bacterium TaxID=2212470 RepID=A0A948W5P5_UNCEI|nr:carboxypeptidase-like regulatory domain-containing protein [Candidatus Eisenbacteria bacterium]MBU2689801.1 carboxypeptidase-like regulatory domain-containing protein [Candidatus Eisenbacteria bacterium]
MAPPTRGACFLCPILIVAAITALSLGLWGISDTPYAQTEAAKMVNAVLEGEVTDVGGFGISGVTIKLFRDSFFVSEITSDTEGHYRLPFSYNANLDKSIVVWFLPQEPDLVPEIIVLRESYQSKELKLLSPCLPRLTLSENIVYDIELLDEKAKLKTLSESECFKGKEKS